MKREPGAWECKWATLSPWDRDLVLEVGGLVARLTTLLCKKKIRYCCEIQRSENRINLAESSKEGYGSKRAVFPMMMTMI
jgi:hypothetical protein